MDSFKIYRTTVFRLGRPAGTIVRMFDGHDYGLSRDDSYYTGKQHSSVKELGKEDRGFFTIANDYLEFVCDSTDMHDMGAVLRSLETIDPDTPEPEPEMIEGKRVCDVTDHIRVPVVGEPAALISDSNVYANIYHTSPVVKIEGNLIFTKNSVYRLSK